MLQLGKSPFLYTLARFLLFKKIYPFCIEYPLNPKSRYGYSHPVHPQLHEMINANRNSYKKILSEFLCFKETLLKIPFKKSAKDKNNPQPYWMNNTFSGIDAVGLYSFIGLYKPKKYFEIGSGNSTKFARQSIKDHNLETKIISIDPHPRANIDTITDKNYRQPIQEIDPNIFSELDASDILFVDNSHRVFMNSDATVTLLDILPRLKKGVIVHFHDITLPYDYPPEWQARLFSEQYVLAAYLLSGGNKFEILLPNAFICKDNELTGILNFFWDHPKMSNVERDGFSFWIRIH